MKKSSPTIFEKTGKFQGGVNLKNFKYFSPRYKITLSNHNPTKLGGWVMTAYAFQKRALDRTNRNELIDCMHIVYEISKHNYSIK